MKKLLIVLTLLLLVGITQVAKADTEQAFPTYKGFWDNYFWFSWEPGDAFWGTANVNVLVDEIDYYLELEVYDPILPQIWWRLRWPQTCNNIFILRGFIGGVPIEELPHEMNVSCQYLPLMIKQ